MNKILEFPAGQEEVRPEFYNTKDISKIMRCSLPTAREVMRRADFPLIIVGRSWMVSKKAFEKWSEARHI